MLYNLRSETDPSSDPAGWPIYGGNENLTATPPENSVTIALPDDSERFFVVERFPAPPEEVFAESFDGAAGLPDGWTAGANTPPDTGTTRWEVGSPSAVGPAAAGTPPRCAGTNISGDYGLETDIYLRTPAIDLSAAGGATLSYFQFADIEEGFDAGSVAVLDADANSELAVLEATVG
ncbi:MAG: hypothetical protein GWO24_24980, partial [Akkermansiaceae bacterium]|nr:hypothetical protein [Akkermansiaceae bacterium]